VDPEEVPAYRVTPLRFAARVATWHSRSDRTGASGTGRAKSIAVCLRGFQLIEPTLRFLQPESLGVGLGLWIEAGNETFRQARALLGGELGRGEAMLGHSLDSEGNCGFTDPTDLSNIDPLLGPLQSNGGPTPMHALQLGSSTIDAIPAASCTYDHDGDPGTPEHEGPARWLHRC
jgi:hypothetical protein